MKRTRQQIKNRADKDRKKRRKLRERMEAAGHDQETIDQIIAQRREADRLRRHGYDIEVDPAYQYDPDNDQGYYPDDTGYEPSQGDPLLRGAARAMGMTKRVIQKGQTITDWQYERSTE